MITFPNYVLKHLANSQQHNIVAALCTILSEQFDSDAIDVKETLKFLTDTKSFDTEQFVISNLNATNVAIFAKAHTHNGSTKGK